VGGNTSPTALEPYSIDLTISRWTAPSATRLPFEALAVNQDLVARRYGFHRTTINYVQIGKW